MTTINVIPTWYVEKLDDDQNFYGIVYPNAVYKFTFVGNTGICYDRVVSIKGLTPVFDGDQITDYKLIIGVEFFETGFKSVRPNEIPDFIMVSAIEGAEREYIKYETCTRENRPVTSDPNPYKFNLVNPKTNGINSFIVGHDCFVGIPAMTKKGNVHTNYGYIDHVDMDESGKVTRVIMNGILSSHGVFHSARTVIPYNAIRGVYFYRIGIEPHKTKVAIDVGNKPETNSEADTTEE